MTDRAAKDFLGDDLLVSLAEQFGTPLYVYHAEKIEEQYRRLTVAFAGSSVKFFYACKALTNVNILKLMRSMGCGLDTVSLQEVELGLHAGFAPAEILFTP